MRVLVVSLAAINAPHRRAYDLLAAEPGWEVHIAAPKLIEDGPVRKPVDPAPGDARYVLHTLPVLLRRIPRMDWFAGLTVLMASIRPDVVFVEWDPGTWPVIHAWLAARPVRAPVVAFTVENIPRDRVADAIDNARHGRVSGAIRDATVAALDFLGVRVIRGLASVNREGMRIFQDEREWAGPVELVPLGTDMELFRPMDVAALRAELGLDGSYVVGYFGRLIPEKGLRVLVEALAQLDDSTRLLLDAFRNFNPGTYVSEILELAYRLGVRRRIVTFDAPHRDVPRYMNCCDVVVLPSLSAPRWREQYGRVIPEAMACGVPVIGSSSGNIPDIIGDAGWVFPEGDVAALADTIRQVRSAPEERLRRRELALSWVREHHSVEAQRDALRRLLTDAVSA